MDDTVSPSAPRLDLSNGVLSVGDREISLTPTLFSMLRHFALNPGRLITRQELLDDVWPDTHVTEGLVKDYVRKIRRVLDDDARHPRFIETARGMGYRLVGSISVVGVDDVAGVPASTPQLRPTIAVLPFAGVSDENDQTYFAAGIAEDIIAELSRFRSMVVKARDSSFLYGAYPEAVGRFARELKAHYILQGSVQRTKERVRIHSRLTEASSGECIWAERYDRELDDLFEVQDELSRAIASTLVGNLEEAGRQRAARKPPASLTVYEHLLLGSWHMRVGTEEEVSKARKMFRRAIELEPTNARAHAEMAFSYLIEFWSGWTPDAESAVDTAFSFASEAVRLDPLDSRAHIYSAAAYHYGKRDFEAAGREYDRANQLNPNDYDAFCLRSWLLALSGRAKQGIACAERAIELSPLTTEDCRVAQCIAAYSAREYNSALRALDKIIEPTYEVGAYRAMCHAQLGNVSESRQAMTDYLVRAQKEIADYPGVDTNRWERFWATRYPFKYAKDLDHMLAGLRKAGMP